MTAQDTKHQPNQAPTGRRRSRRWVALGAAVVLLGLGLSACGRGSPKAPPISGCSPSGCSNSSSSQRLEADALAYSACIRSHGITDFPDPTIGPNGLPTWSNPGPAQDETAAQYKTATQAEPAAQKACKNDLPDLGPQNPAQRAAAVAEAVRYAECMRSHGEPTFPDPNSQGVIKVENATGILDPGSPQYRRAQTACQSRDKGFAEQFSAAAAGSHPSNAGGG